MKWKTDVRTLQYDDDDELFCGMVDQRKAFSLISSRDHCQRSSPSRISQGFEFRLSWMKLCSSDNHYTTAPYFLLIFFLLKWDFLSNHFVILNVIISIFLPIHQPTQNVRLTFSMTKWLWTSPSSIYQKLDSLDVEEWMWTQWQPYSTRTFGYFFIMFCYRRWEGGEETLLLVFTSNRILHVV